MSITVWYLIPYAVGSWEWMMMMMVVRYVRVCLGLSGSGSVSVRFPWWWSGIGGQEQRKDDRDAILHAFTLVVCFGWDFEVMPVDCSRDWLCAISHVNHNIVAHLALSGICHLLVTTTPYNKSNDIIQLNIDNIHHFVQIQVIEIKEK